VQGRRLPRAPALETIARAVEKILMVKMLTVNVKMKRETQGVHIVTDSSGGGC
jgi:hypothetical protein